MALSSPPLMSRPVVVGVLGEAIGHLNFTISRGAVPFWLRKKRDRLS
jgi:hypothetical protein